MWTVQKYQLYNSMLYKKEIFDYYPVGICDTHKVWLKYALYVHEELYSAYLKTFYHSSYMAIVYH